MLSFTARERCFHRNVRLVLRLTRVNHPSPPVFSCVVSQSTALPLLQCSSCYTCFKGLSMTARVYVDTKRISNDRHTSVNLYSVHLWRLRNFSQIASDNGDFRVRYENYSVYHWRFLITLSLIETLQVTHKASRLIHGIRDIPLFSVFLRRPMGCCRQCRGITYAPPPSSTPLRLWQWRCITRFPFFGWFPLLLGYGYRVAIVHFVSGGIVAISLVRRMTLNYLSLVILIGVGGGGKWREREEAPSLFMLILSCAKHRLMKQRLVG